MSVSRVDFLYPGNYSNVFVLGKDLMSNCINIDCYQDPPHYAAVKEFFLQRLEKKVFNSKDLGFKISQLQALSEIFQMIIDNENIEEIQNFLKKQKGYVHRLFSNETWEEWTESRTALGKVINAFMEGLEGLTKLSVLSKQFSEVSIKVANDEARDLIEQVHKNAHIKNSQHLQDFGCPLSLTLATMASITTQNPIPIILGITNCVNVVNAQRSPPARSPSQQVIDHVNDVRNSIFQHARPGHTTRYTIIGNSKPIHDEIYINPNKDKKEEMLQELAGRIPSSLMKLFLEGENWVGCLLGGVGNFILDVTGITEPNDKLKISLSEMEESYWIDIVRKEYMDIFSNPEDSTISGGFKNLNQWNRAVMETMKSNLRLYGYDDSLPITPIQFIRSLKHQNFVN